MPTGNENPNTDEIISDEDETIGAYASPPCFMHELSSEYTMGPSSAGNPNRDVMRWRKSERERLIKERLDIAIDDRDRFSVEIAKRLDALLENVRGAIISAYWPFRGEPDLRPWMKQVVARGGRCALPVVVERGRPLIFRCWKHGEPLERGVWNIPIPRPGQEVVPDIVIAPLVGFDSSRYRLGYGGGFFDRTLAHLGSKPKVIGVGYACAEISTIYPQPHDIPMDAIVTESVSIT